jgi:hypothetical protein
MKTYNAKIELFKKAITIFFSVSKKNLQFTFRVKYADIYRQYTQLSLPYAKH